jgi:hypothetical protein
LQKDDATILVEVEHLGALLIATSGSAAELAAYLDMQGHVLPPLMYLVRC